MGTRSTHWTANELLAFNIQVKHATTASFFDMTDLPAPPVFETETILNNLEEPNDPLSKPDRKFFQYLQMAGSEESAGHDFAAYLLKLLVYDRDGYRRGISSDRAEPQLIFKAIAVSHMNNLCRSKSGLPLLESQVIPGVIMVGTAPTFYRITVTTALIDALVTSTYPAESTIVLKYIPQVPDPVNYSIQGMQPLENRRVVFQCFEAFKTVVNACTVVLHSTPC